MPPFSTTPIFMTITESAEGFPLLLRMDDHGEQRTVVRALGKKCGGSTNCLRQIGHSGPCWECSRDLFNKTPGVWVVVASTEELREAHNA